MADGQRDDGALMAALSPPLTGIDTILVTGATGFVGRHLVARLKAMGKTVVTVSRSAGFDLTRDRAPLEGVGHVFHAAALIGVGQSWQDPIAYLDVNAMGTARLLEECRAAGCGFTLIGAYTYGVPERLPIAETDRVRPNNPYALSKYIAEQACRFYADYCGVPAAVLRIFNIYGPGQDERMLIPFIARQVLDRKLDTVEVMDLGPRRDYVHVADVVEAILAVSQGHAGQVFNVGSGQSWSVEEIVQMVMRAAGVAKPYRERNARRAEEIDDTVADIRHIRAAAGWAPRISFEQGLAQVIEDLRVRCAA